MRYVDTAGLDERQAALLERCEAQLLALILPNVPAGDEQIAAFSQAVPIQAEQQETAPEGVTGFRLGSYSVTLDGRRRAACPQARAVLISAGLLCRSVKAC